MFQLHVDPISHKFSVGFTTASKTASRKRKYASIEEIEETHQSPDEEESAGDRKRRKNRLHCALYRFHQRSAQVDGNERVGGNAHVIKKFAEQVKHKKTAKESESAIVFVTKKVEP
ncbi:hypothetical protein PC110_g19831 [Phytophthora cactorum]|uniref:Uncharacterized protein n=1 Tax=Phytophthora cactorum TaxID=29920 RepID=A0A329RKA3_9STRA|nr:hypothetical protein PC110_g19831 [Phytophthora cactorum]